MSGPCGFCRHFASSYDRGTGMQDECCAVDAEFEGCGAGRPCPSFVAFGVEESLYEDLERERDEMYWKEFYCLDEEIEEDRRVLNGILEYIGARIGAMTGPDGSPVRGCKAAVGDLSDYARMARIGLATPSLADPWVIRRMAESDARVRSGRRAVELAALAAEIGRLTAC